MNWYKVSFGNEWYGWLSPSGEFIHNNNEDHLGAENYIRDTRYPGEIIELHYEFLMRKGWLRLSGSSSVFVENDITKTYTISQKKYLKELHDSKNISILFDNGSGRNIALYDTNEYVTSQALARPTKPINTVRKRDIIKNPGTNTAKSLIQYQFTTSYGNVVKVQMEPQGDDSYNIVFYVNDTLADESSKTENSARDKDILPGVLYVIKNKANKLKAKTITFHAIKGKGDTKVMNKTDPSPYLNNVIKELRNLTVTLNNHKVTMIEPDEGIINLYKKLNMGTPEARPDLDINRVLGYISQVTYAIQNNDITKYPTEVAKACNDVVANLYSNIDWNKFNINIEPAIASLKNLEGAIYSNTEIGWLTNKNRRSSIYDKLLNRYFSDEWDIKKSNSYFTLTRKSNELV